MKILIIIPSYKPAYIYGGPIQSVANLAEALSGDGHDVTVFTTTANGANELNVEPNQVNDIEGVKVTYFRRLTKGHSSLSPALLKSLYQNAHHFDIIHIQSWWNLIAIPATWICLLKGVTPLVSPRGTLTGFSLTHSRSQVKKLFHRLYGRKLLNHVTLVFTSEREKEEALKFVSGKSVHVLPNILDLPLRILNTHEDTPYLKLIFLGRIDPAKNLEGLINVLSGLKAFPFELIIAGEGNYDYTEKLKRQAAGINAIKWIGAVDGDEKYRRLAEADLLILPSHIENFGNVVFEALSQGTPVLLSAHVGAKEYVAQHGLGWVVDGDENDWRETLREIWQNKTAREDIRRRAPDAIARDFNKGEQGKAYLDVYTHHLEQFSKG